MINWANLLFICLFLFNSSVQARSFQAEGSDLMMGVGPKNMALAGAVVAVSDDVYAGFWNPAGLSQIKGINLSVARQLNAKLIPMNFFGAAVSTKLLRKLSLDSTLAFSFIPRLHVKAEGAFKEDDFESIFIRYALPGLPTNFDGEVDSKTKDYRFSWGIAPEKNDSWRFGMSISYIECGTRFCGVFARDPDNFTIASTDATAWAVHIGGKYHYDDTLTFGFSLKDLNTTLDVETIISDDQGTRTKIFHTSFPRDLTLALAWQYTPQIRLSSDLQYMFGHYGNYGIDFRIWRNGISYLSGPWRYRAGLMIPLLLESEQIEEVEPPLPFTPTVGLSWQRQGFTADLVLYVHPIMSYQLKKPHPAMDFSLTLDF